MMECPDTKSHRIKLLAGYTPTDTSSGQQILNEALFTTSISHTKTHS